MGYAFISYSTKNQALADSVRELFRKNSVETWMAPGDIPAGSKYAMVINRAIKDCSCFVLLLTDDSQNSVWVSKEVERAVNYRKAVITIRLEDVVLNDEFEFYISTDQVVAMNKIDENSDEAQKVLAAVTAYAGQTLVAEEATEKPETDTVKKDIQAEKKPSEAVGNKDKSAGKEKDSFVEACGDDKGYFVKEEPKKEAFVSSAKNKKYNLEAVIDEYNKYRVNNADEIKRIIKLSNRRINNAIDYIAESKSVSVADVVALCDGTIMGSGKSGILFLNDRFIWKYIGDNLRLRYSQVKSARKEDSYIIIETGDGMTFKMTEPVGGKEIHLFFNKLGKYNESTCGVEAISRLCVGAVNSVNDVLSAGYIKLTFGPALRAEHIEKIRKGLGVDADEYVVAALDTTISNNGKQGMVLTTNSFYWDELKECSPIRLDDITDVEIGGNGDVLSIGLKSGNRIIKNVYKNYISVAYGLIDYIVKNR